MTVISLSGAYELQRVLIAYGVIPDLCTKMTLHMDVKARDTVTIDYTVIADKDKTERIEEALRQWSGNEETRFE